MISLLSTLRHTQNLYIENLVKIPSRGVKKRRLKEEKIIRHEWPDGVKHYGFTYYPRPGEQDPPYEPTKLFMVQRVKKRNGNPYWVKQILKEYGLDQNMSDYAIVKNTELENKKLWLVKHVVKITPITFPDGLPEEGDYTGTYLNERGELRVNQKLKVDADRMFATESKLVDPHSVDRNAIEKDSRKKWLHSPFDIMV